MHITEIEYLERIVNMLPSTRFQPNQYISINSLAEAMNKENIISCCLMIEDLAEQNIKNLSKFQETDPVLELKDVSFDMAVLGRFLGIVCLTILENIDENPS